MGLQLAQQQTPVLEDQAVQGNACSCLSSLLCHFGCDSSRSTTEALIANVRAQLAASASLRAVLAAAAASSVAENGVGGAV